MPLMALGQQALHGRFAQSSGGNIRNPQQTQVIVRVDKNFEISEKIFDLAPVKKALTADQLIGHARLSQCGLQGPRLDVGAKQNRLLRPRNALNEPHELDLFDDPPPFFVLILEGEEINLLSRALV